MPVFLYILISVIAVSLISLVGVAYFAFSAKALSKSMPWLVAFAAGALLGASFFDLVPESFEMLGAKASIYIVAGILLFLVFENVLHWHHAHHHDCEDCAQQATGYSILLGDGLHNFLDGILIASAFMLNIGTGIAVTIAVLLHEIPQEIGDFAVLVHSGFSKVRAVLFNLISALTAVLGGVLAYLSLQNIEKVVPYVVAIGAGGFLYIALVDLFAELKTSRYLSVRLGQVVTVVIGLVVLYVVQSQ